MAIVLCKGTKTIMNSFGKKVNIINDHKSEDFQMFKNIY